MEKAVKTSVSLPPTLWKKVRMRALAQGRDASELLAEALQALVKRPTKKGR